MGVLERLNRRIEEARKRRAQKGKKQKEAKKKAKQHKEASKKKAPGSPGRAREKRKTHYWQGVKRRARKQRAFWNTVLNRRRRKKLAYLKKHAPAVPSGMNTPDKPWNPYRRQVCGWMVPEIDKIWARGWRGAVVSGVRTPEYSEQLCYNMCNAPTCSGMCAGRSSNHNATTCQFPQGAIDVSDYYNFAVYARAVGSRLKNNLPADRVHFSYTGN